MDKNSLETTERRLESLVFHQHDVQNKFVYYILAVNAACIGFSVNFTKDIPLTKAEIPLGIAILSWGLSFYYGIMQIQNHEIAIRLNITELRAYVKQIKLSEDINQKQLVAQDKGSKYRKRQNLLLLIGIAFFLLWRTYKMLI